MINLYFFSFLLNNYLNIDKFNLLLSINHMLNISNDQVYESYQEMIPICGRDHNRVYNTIRRGNSYQEMKFLTNSADNKSM